MTYQSVASIFVFCSIILFVVSIIIKVEEKRKLSEKFILRKASSASNSTIDFLVRLFGPLMPAKSKLDEIKYYLEQLEYKNISPERIYFYTIGGGILFGFFYFFLLAVINIFLAIPGIFLGIILGYQLPIIYLRSKYESIQKEKQMGILPYVEMLQVTCEAGLTLTLAIDRVYEYYPTSLALEFKKANNDFMANIKTRRESLLGIIERVGGDEIRFLIESIIQSLETGSPIKGVLKMLADTIRRELRKKIIMQGQKAKWKNFIVSICFQFPPYIFIIAGPALVGLMGSL